MIKFDQVSIEREEFSTSGGVLAISLCHTLVFPYLKAFIFTLYRGVLIDGDKT